jgi:uncharacterized protein (TIGR03067 family)
MRDSLIGRAIVGAIVTATAAIASADDATDAAIQKDRNQIKGTWRVVELVVNGSMAMDEDARKLTVVNGSDGSWSLCSEGKEITKGTSAFDPTKTPKTIDFTPTDGANYTSATASVYSAVAPLRAIVSP